MCEFTWLRISNREIRGFVRYKTIAKKIGKTRKERERERNISVYIATIGATKTLN